jgi:hypothetical protein
MYDWSAIYMSDVAGAAIEHSGYGYAAFTMGMTLGRFGIDFVRPYIRDNTILTLRRDAARAAPLAKAFRLSFNKL